MDFYLYICHIIKRKNKMSKKIILGVGIPYSGKSTYFNNLVKEDPNKYFLVNRDKIRELFFGYGEENHDEYYNRKDIYYLECEVTRRLHDLIYYGLSQNKTILVDNTNLTIREIRGYEKFNVPIELVHFDITFGEAIERRNKRIKKVEDRVIKKYISRKQTLDSILKKEPYNFVPRVMKNNPLFESIIIVDIDGTIANMNGIRKHYEFEKVIFDKPKHNIIELVKLLSHEYKIVFVSGRSDECREDTIKWLDEYFYFEYELHMRKSDDKSDDWKIKEEIWLKLLEKYYIKLMIDDRSQVVNHARSLGFEVLQVDYGNF